MYDWGARMKMNLSVWGNIGPGLIGAVIFAIIAAATGGSLSVVIVGALLIGVATFLVAFLITRAITAARVHGSR